eukprot:TRINITY_DN28684_c0_g1_i1.p1 TRINITY_DN28684_c0_g1~~TRINITY_DN28684_c0_g1_i1.p1  ORF type:complete len:524 (+),score=16.89 TRINITY_DN28684_c0_g1_i1:42-1613(+)
MSSNYKKIQIKSYPKLPGKNTHEERYWGKFEHPVLVKELAAVTHVEFSPVAPYEFAVTSSTRVNIYDPSTVEVQKTISRFKDVAYSGSYRSDGKLIVAGGEQPVVKLFDATSRTQLRWFKGHTNAIRVAKFSPDLVHVLSGSNDKTVRYWDISSQEEVTMFEGHTDYVRCGAVTASNPNLFVSGGYDHKLFLWDMRTKSSVLTVDHGSPVEGVLFMPGGSVVISAGGTELKVWDILGGTGRFLHTMSNHAKTVTSIALESDGSRLLSGGLDQMVKVYDVRDFSVQHSLTYPAGVLSVAISPDNRQVVVGMSDGMVSVKTRVVKMQEVVQHRHTQDQIRRGTYRFFIRGKNSQAGKEDYRVEKARKEKLKDYDKYLKKFQYKNALDAALATKHAAVVASMITELARRDGLRIALGGRDEVTLQPLLVFLHQHIADPRYSSLAIDITNILLDIYSTVLGRSSEIDKLIAKIQSKVTEEMLFQKQMYELLGAMDCLLTSATIQAAPVDLPVPVKQSRQSVDAMETI